MSQHKGESLEKRQRLLIGSKVHTFHDIFFEMCTKLPAPRPSPCGLGTCSGCFGCWAFLVLLLALFLTKVTIIIIIIIVFIQKQGEQTTRKAR
mmetsp:Transcript_32049/g.78645  ORF Transcript_32049/g.78645 Transcript_32049/m.78645 type:complete len:93 (-) Transcript_32049:498-776(-)